MLSIGIYFSLMIIGLSAKLPHSLYAGLTAHGVAAATATRISHLSPVSTLFASLLGANPVRSLLGTHGLAHLTHAQVAALTGRHFFPSLISPAFAGALTAALRFSFVAYLIAAAASWLRGGTYQWSAEPAASGVDPAARPRRRSVAERHREDDLRARDGDELAGQLRPPIQRIDRHIRQRDEITLGRVEHVRDRLR